MVSIRTLSILVLVGVFMCFCSDSANGWVGPLVSTIFRSQAFRAAKLANNIPKGQQPIRTIKVPDKNNGQMLRQYDYINNQGKPISIRQDLPRNYNHPNGAGNQGHHFNAGSTGEKLKQHYYFNKFNSKNG